jgi:toxin CcdB
MWWRRKVLRSRSGELSDYFLDTPQLGAIPLQELKTKVGSAQAYQFDIQTALDRLFGAY